MSRSTALLFYSSQSPETGALTPNMLADYADDGEGDFYSSHICPKCDHWHPSLEEGWTPVDPT